MRRSCGKYCAVAKLAFLQMVILVERVSMGLPSLPSRRSVVVQYAVSRQVGVRNLDQLLAVLVQKSRSGQTLAVIYPDGEPWSVLVRMHMMCMYTKIRIYYIYFHGQIKNINAFICTHFLVL